MRKRSDNTKKLKALLATIVESYAEASKIVRSGGLSLTDEEISRFEAGYRASYLIEQIVDE